MDETNLNYAKIMDYIDHNPAAVLGTVGEDGPHGAVVYVIPASHGTVCFVTRNQTKKYLNLAKHPPVSLTFFNERERTTLQAAGKAFVADNQSLQDIVMDKVNKAHAMMADWLPPVTELRNGTYIVIGVELTWARLADYGNVGVDGPTFIELK